MAGFKGLVLRVPYGVRQVCIHDLIRESLEPAYLSIIRRLSNADVVFDHWLHFKSTKLQVTWQHESESSPKDLQDLFDRIIKAYIRNLILADDPKRAWQVLEESGCRSDVLRESTWDDLLEHPEYIRKRRDGMSERVLHKYDEYLSRIERILGVRSSGGEDGFHLPVRSQGEPEDDPESEG